VRSHRRDDVDGNRVSVYSISRSQKGAITTDDGRIDETCVTEDSEGWITVKRMKKRKDRKK
jgi:hypothetical protein